MKKTIITSFLLLCFAVIGYAQHIDAEYNSNSIDPHILIQETDSTDFARFFMSSNGLKDRWNISSISTPSVMGPSGAAPLVIGYNTITKLAVSKDGVVTINGAYTLPSSSGNVGDVLQLVSPSEADWVGGGGGSGVFTDIAGNISAGITTSNFIFGRGVLPPPTPVSDKMFFFEKNKGAFRAGQLTSSDVWAPDSIGIASLAVGLNALALGPYSVSLGEASRATTNNSIAMGRECISRGTNGATAIGFKSIANVRSCVVVGRLNEELAAPNTAPNTSLDNPLFVVGNGASAAVRSNALVVEFGGDTEFGGNALPMTDNTDNVGSTSQRWNTIYATNGTINTSDVRAKKNIQGITYGLDDIMKLRPVQYHWNAEASSEEQHLGVIAQEILTVLPEVVNVPTDEDELLGVKYADIVPVLIKAIQELKEENDGLRAEVREITAQVALLLDKEVKEENSILGRE